MESASVLSLPFLKSLVKWEQIWTLFRSWVNGVGYIIFFLRRCMLVCVIAAELWISSPECKLCWLKCSYWIFNIVIKVSFNLSFISTLINVYYACYNLYCQKCYRVFKRNFISTHKDTQFLMAVNGWERNERKKKKGANSP